MPDPILVPPVPTVAQGEKVSPLPDTPENRDFQKSVLSIFDRVAPEKFQKSPVQTEKIPEKPKEQEPVQPEETAPKEVSPEPTRKLPSFLEKALTTEPQKETPQKETPPEEGEWPEEMPQVQTTEEQRNNYKKWRAAYKQAKDEVAALKSQPHLDEATKGQISLLENDNRAMREQLQRMGVEQHREFQQKIIQPMQAAWADASRIVKEVGGDPQELAKALNLTGKAQFEALDEVLREVPESAKLEVNQAIAAYRRLDEHRKAVLDKRNLPQTVEALRKKDMETQLTFLNKQKEQMRSMYDQAVAKLRDEAGVEVLQKSNDPDAAWWNDQADQIESVGRGVFIDNTDLSKMAYACAMAPMADVYRKLWLRERTERLKSDRTLKERFGSEPTLSESGGNFKSEPNPQEDLKKPFADVFIRTLHRQSSR